MRQPILNWLQAHVDFVLVLVGVLLGVGLPFLLTDQRSSLASFRGSLPILIGGFVIAGISAVIVGLKGLHGHYFSLDERREAVLRMACVLLIAATVSCIGYVAAITAWKTMPSVSENSGNSMPSWLNPIRLAIACVGAGFGFYLATLRPPANEAKVFWLSVFGGLAGWCVAYHVIMLLLIAGAGILAISSNMITW